MGLSGVEPLTSRLSGVRSNHLSYRPARTYLSYSVQSVPQSVPQLSVSDRLLVLTDPVLDDLRPMLHLPEMPIHLLDHCRGRVPDLPRHRKGRNRHPVVRGLNTGTNVGVPEHLGRDLAFLNQPARQRDVLRTVGGLGVGDERERLPHALDVGRALRLGATLRPAWPEPSLMQAAR